MVIPDILKPPLIFGDKRQYEALKALEESEGFCETCDGEGMIECADCDGTGKQDE